MNTVRKTEQQQILSLLMKIVYGVSVRRRTLLKILILNTKQHQLNLFSFLFFFFKLCEHLFCVLVLLSSYEKYSLANKPGAE